ncbi:hypothetical protein CANCADRAFT_21470 [Tortispora caseinolytica NRRL Y-17796]|uniref:Pyridoxal phosphate homeostasis protein n=1 Tax=Tortispora caseinolytica NRRL Y-17796 TaxID=767744 RepID=A0A1E4TJU8_9ASCO|nr:hypothetical protein CANCADRAFT_21470 [Tortispora caseinolytica NRRL Y-17796]
MASRAKELENNYLKILERVNKAANGRNVRLVAVSKLKPAQDIQHLYDVGVRHFGENYVQELLDKSKVLPKDINWHFIGGLQSNKCKTLAAEIPNLWAVETVDTEKKATKLDANRSGLSPIRVFIQVNTSDEPEKSGVSPDDLIPLAKHIIDSCPNLHLQGLMTIGALARSQAAAESSDEHNPDFVLLKSLADKLQSTFNMSNLELSMGMSRDFEDAISLGSTNVRVGSDIFGARPPKGA